MFPFLYFQQFQESNATDPNSIALQYLNNSILNLPSCFPESHFHKKSPNLAKFHHCFHKKVQNAAAPSF
ncbi:hypothetical protein EXN66_Car009362 [Channa argus]|uniref:Uncharacterized protein n=1 Tax=Channa argus TaxID=215402 RepID=A0A6G1PUM3_CHAAH|nr:hypothetical protein EXN66_Car009362 [Channa argus]